MPFSRQAAPQAMALLHFASPAQSMTVCLQVPVVCAHSALVQAVAAASPQVEMLPSSASVLPQ